MDRRVQLHNELLKLAPKAYYNPPASVSMDYPCFVYHLSDVRSHYADNMAYKNFPSYLVTYISTSLADQKVYEMLEHFPYCRFDRYYTADNLHHYAFELFY